jgi:hypothetical protein
MNETSITKDVLRDLRSHLPAAVVLKHKDTGTKGIPDISVAARDRTSWIELKYLRERDTLKGINDAVQLSLCHRLGQVNNGRSWVVIYEEEPHQVTVWRPSALFAKLWPRIAGHVSAWSKIGTEPVVITMSDFLRDGTSVPGLRPALEVHGAVTIGSWSYFIPTVLVQTALREP